jgi:hypothetical protein
MDMTPTLTVPLAYSVAPSGHALPPSSATASDAGAARPGPTPRAQALGIIGALDPHTHKVNQADLQGEGKLEREGVRPQRQPGATTTAAQGEARTLSTLGALRGHPGSPVAEKRPVWDSKLVIANVVEISLRIRKIFRYVPHVWRGANAQDACRMCKSGLSRGRVISASVQCAATSAPCRFRRQAASARRRSGP